MANSMTGYGLGRGDHQGVVLVAELRSVNHRYLEVRAHFPPSLLSHETHASARLQRRLSRGRVELHLRVDRSSRALTRVRPDLQLAGQYLAALQELGDHLHLPGAIDVMAVAGLREVLVGDEPVAHTDEIRQALDAAVDAALDDLESSRAKEGERLVDDLLARLDTLETLTGQVDTRLPPLAAQIRERLEGRVRELLEAAGTRAAPDESRLLTEVALLAERSDATEELVRLRTHVGAMRNLLGKDGPVGRKADFLCQELLREINTLGSKVNDAQVTGLVIELKTELERVREQVQNLE